MTIKNKIDLKWLIAVIMILPVFTFAQSGATNKNSHTAIEPGISQESAWMSHRSRNVNDSEWMHYDDTENSDSWGFLISGEEYDIVAKWDPEDISDYDEWIITKIKFIVVNANPYLKIKVWEGPDFTEIYSEDVDEFNVNSWTEITLETPVVIDASTELYIGYHVDMLHMELGGFVTATDDGPPVDEYGNLYLFDGTWYSDFNNHNLQALFESNLTSNFEADVTEICTGGTVNFTELATGEVTYDWTFEGGTPATSNDANPSVVYNTPGYYDVTLEVTDAGGISLTETKDEYIAVLDIPAQADMPDGEAEICTGSFYQYEIPEVLYATDYEWLLTPADAGELYVEQNNATLETSTTWTGDYTISVRAMNQCGDGEWSDDLEGTLSLSPEVYELQGGGSYCLGEDGVEITLDGSQEGIDYELFLDGESTGNIVAGTGAEISFGLLTDEGYYEAYGSNDNCEIVMSTQIQVSVDYQPVEPATPEGPTVICNEATAEYVTSDQDDADSFVWAVSPEEAGTIEGTGTMATVTWDTGFSGTAYVSVNGINDCGEGNPSEELEVSVGSPNPEVEGEDFVCDFQVEDYMAEENDGSTYTWTVTGGTITNGDGTYMVTVEWGEIGTGYLSVSEETADGCAGDSEDFEVTIDACTAIGEPGEDVDISVYPNPVSGDMIYVDNLDSSKEYTIQILNTAGSLMFETRATGQKQSIDVAELSTGLYLLKVSHTGTTIHLSKFIKR